MKRPAPGFTLVEVLLAALFIGLLAAVGVGGLMPFVRNSQVENAAAETGTILRYAISEVRRTNRTLDVTFSGSTVTVKRGTATVRTAQLPLTPTLTCRSTAACPTTYTFAAPFGTNGMDFAATFTAGNRQRTLLVRGPLGSVSTQ